MKKLDEILKNLPQKPGVYIMKNSLWKVIYVGKSVNLKSRVNSYFNGKSKLNFAKQNMVGQIKDITFIETNNELEALILETNYIKQYRPKYNILMKDDKNLVYIKITNDIIPEVIKTRIKNENWEYFWPFPSTSNVTNILELVKKLFKIRSCHIKFSLEKDELKILSKNWIQNTPCIDYYIWLCNWPCKLENGSLQIYSQNVERLRSFLKWNYSDILKEMEEEMIIKASNKQFEDAGKLRDQIKSIKELSEKQLARDTIPWDNDIYAGFEKYGKIFVWLTQIRWWEISWVISSKIENNLEDSFEEVFVEYFQNKYIWEEENYIKNLNIITTEEIKDKVLQEYFKKNSIKLETPSIGPKLNILNFTKNNLLNFAYREELWEIGKKTLTRNTQNNILKALNYEEKKKWDIIFECYDISHLGWTNTVASRSVIVNGKSDSSKYKKYKLKTIKSWEVDDFKSMQEILERRTLEAIKLNNWPDLIVIDWGKWQLSSAVFAIEKLMNAEYRIQNAESKMKSVIARSDSDVAIYNLNEKYRIPNICSIAKREEEVFVPNISEPVIFSKWTPEIMLLQKIRDEAHRFAITFNRAKRDKAIKKNILEELPWFWAKTRQKLLKLAWNVDNIKNIEIWELSKIISINQIEILKDHGII